MKFQPRFGSLVIVAAVLVSACHKSPTGSAELTSAPLATLQPKIPDSAIVDAVQRRFQADRVLSLEPVHVTVVDGVTTLTGLVGDLLAKERAVSVVETLRGVRAVIDRIDVVPVARPDADVTADVKRKLAADRTTQRMPIIVTTHHGRVTIAGTVPSWPARTVVTDVVKRVNGVSSIDDELVVHYPFVRTDADVATAVREHLANDIWLDGTPIDVHVVGGEVRLRGVVASVAEKERAANDGWLAGVTKVDDSGIVVDWARHDDRRSSLLPPIHTDAEITTAVRDAYGLDPRLDILQPDVTVTNGVVELTGTVEDAAARNAAELDARDTVGVVDVEDEATVVPENHAAPHQIDRHLERAFGRDMLIPNASAIQGEASAKGDVVLKGDVDSPLERSSAVADATRIPGVAKVVDNLKVTESPEVIRSDIVDRLFWDAAVPRNRITVTVDPEGVATLKGTVDTWSDIRAAVEDAHAAGASRVVSLLRLKTGPSG